MDNWKFDPEMGNVVLYRRQAVKQEDANYHVVETEMKSNGGYRIRTFYTDAEDGKKPESPEMQQFLKRGRNLKNPEEKEMPMKKVISEKKKSKKGKNLRDSGIVQIQTDINKITQKPVTESVKTTTPLATTEKVKVTTERTISTTKIVETTKIPVKSTTEKVEIKTTVPSTTSTTVKMTDPTTEATTTIKIETPSTTAKTTVPTTSEGTTMKVEASSTTILTTTVVPTTEKTTSAATTTTTTTTEKSTTTAPTTTTPTTTKVAEARFFPEMEGDLKIPVSIKYTEIKRTTPVESTSEDKSTSSADVTVTTSAPRGSQKFDNTT